MAQLFNPILGNPSGKLGNMVFRVRKGASFIAGRPSKRTSPLKEAETAYRAKFALVQKIARGINSIGSLKEVWPSATGRGSKCNEIFQVNYKIIDTAANLASVLVAPIFGFNAPNAVLTAGATGIHLVTDALGVGLGVDTSVEKYILTAGIVVLSNPIMENITANQVISFQSIRHNLDLINGIDHTADFAGGTLEMYNGYTTKKVFACLVTLNDSGKAIRYSTTFNS
ncbi:MAG: hypothetical protein P4L27_00070 [Ignavibacteriaceae bacterium]|nr:hypothetical protein [Ignavibacteriaceae bacterium]